VQIFRFDPEVSIPISQFGSSFAIGPITGPDSNVQVQIIHVGPGGLIGRHIAPVRQFLAVLAGSGWGSGADGKHRTLRAGYGALWEQGEEHEAGTDTGLTAASIEGVFDMWAMGVTREVVVSDYDPKWPSRFQRVHEAIWPAVADLAIRTDHVGSTAVPGLAAKPIIDIDIVVASEDGVEPVIKRLAGLGYRWRGDLGVGGREAFAPIPASDLPAHNLYLVVENNKAHLDHWLLRDLLRTDPEARARYGALKRQNAELADSDMDFYIAAKADLVSQLLARARAERGLEPATYWDPISQP
jgi:GrpB-like predicted nucleotidyltransferase (UPF0157 family)